MGWPGPMTYTQYIAWQDFLRRDLNEPNRSDHYLMRIACEIRSIFKDNAGRDDYRVRFTSASVSTGLTLQQEGKLQRQIVLARLGFAEEDFTIVERA